MGVRLHLLLATVCVTALAGWTVGQSRCTRIAWGDATGVGTNYSPIILQAGIRDWKVSITKPDCSDVIGLSVTVCDYDVPPKVQFVKDYVVYVHRTGQIEYPASVVATAYCGDPFGASNNQPQVGAPAFDTNWKKGADVVAVPN